MALDGRIMPPGTLFLRCNKDVRAFLPGEQPYEQLLFVYVYMCGPDINALIAQKKLPDALLSKMIDIFASIKYETRI